MKAKKDKPRRGPRKLTVPFEKHSADAPAIVDGRFTVPAQGRVWVWRSRAGCKPSWHPCRVMKVLEKAVDVWDEVDEQWYGFDPTASNAPDVRIIP